MRGNGRIFLRGQIYWIAYYLRGVEQRESSGSADLKVAEKCLKARLREVGADLIGARTFTTPKASRLTVHELQEALKADFELRGKASPQTLCVLKRVDTDFGDHRAVELTAEKIDAYIEAACQRRRKGNHQSRNATTRAILRLGHSARASFEGPIHPTSVRSGQRAPRVF
jgi:hypothetical protein